ncbi:MAG TPA: hypothetical protein VMY37_25070 [Thermoguttaceae bacterium]|nr:hypothetical protein [Thermoguttaceae bacterium]
MDEQLRLTDLVPRRLAVFVLVLAAGLAVVAGLVGLYAWMPRVAGLTTDGRVAAFDLDGEGSLAVWFSSMTLALAGLVAILVFTVRRHRTDDYPGRYRVWLWAATCWFLLSIDETSSLHEGFKEMMVMLTGTRVFGDGSIWWVAVYFFLLGAVGTRLLVDMRACWLSSAALVGVAACYVVAVVAQLGWILPESGALGVMLEESAEMVGNLMLLLAMGLHARHVILDAQGLLRHRREEEASDEEEFEEEEVDQESFSLFGRSVVVHPPHGVPRPAARAATPSRSERATVRAATTSRPQSAAAQSESDTSTTPARRKLTKTERKALRKRLAKMQAERERRRAG